MTRVFQSTLPVWGATRQTLRIAVLITFQSTLPVWGATCSPQHKDSAGGYFNPRSPCGERLHHNYEKQAENRFQSTLPVWGATTVSTEDKFTVIISIHAPRVGSDPARYSSQRHRCNFNPRSPCGERLYHTYCITAGTPISIHAPRVGSDNRSCTLLCCHMYFNPRSPCGERPHVPPLSVTGQQEISIHAPRVGSDRYLLCRMLRMSISIHAPRVGSDIATL